VQGIREREEDSDEGASFASYNSYVEREMGGIINMVKVGMTPGGWSSAGWLLHEQIAMSGQNETGYLAAYRLRV
jgi:hypothetical protein